MLALPAPGSQGFRPWLRLEGWTTLKGTAQRRRMVLLEQDPEGGVEMPAAVKKATATVPAHRAEKTAFAVLGVLEKAGKEITLLAREGKKRVAAHERKAVSAARDPKKARKA